MKPVIAVDYAVIAIYMALMLGIGIFAMRLNRGVGDYFRGGSRVHWLAAGLSSFMSGFSAWTFTGAAGLAYQHGLVAILLYVGNACTFLLGYWIFAARWRRARLTTVMEYLVERYDERTRQAFAWTTIFFQLFTGAGMLYGLAIFVAPACGWPITWTVAGCGVIILAYTAIGGLWAVVITDFLQAAILMPFTLLLAIVAVVRLGGLGVIPASLPAAMTSWRLPDPQFSWAYVALWTVMTSIGYNTSAMAQRYFSVEDERAARRVALLCFVLFLCGSGIWFVPPMAMRVMYPTLGLVWPGLSNPQESVYALAAVTLLPNGLIGIMLAAIFSATMSSISGLLNVHAAVISKDILPTLFPRRRGTPESLATGWIATLAVGSAMTALATAMAVQGRSVFDVFITFNTVMSLAYGPPALLGLVTSRAPSWSGLLTFTVGLVLGCYGSFVASPAWGLVRTVAIVVSVSVVLFLLTMLAPDADTADRVASRRRFAERLRTPVDRDEEVDASDDPTAAIFRFLSLAIGGTGLAALLLLGSASGSDRWTVVGYAALTLAIAAALSKVGKGGPSPRGRVIPAATRHDGPR